MSSLDLQREDDAFGEYLLARLDGRETRAEFIERDDGYLDIGSMAGPYFFSYEEWSPDERKVVDLARGRILDVGCGAGRHALYLQAKGLEVTGIDASPGAIEVCRRRGLRDAWVRPLAEIDRFAPRTFDTVLMLGANFGLLESAERAQRHLENLHLVTSPDARILANTRDPYRTESIDHLEYHERNRNRGRMPGQVRIRVRHGRLAGAWFDYLFVSAIEMRDLLAPSGWELESLVESDGAGYFAVMRKRDR